MGPAQPYRRRAPSGGWWKARVLLPLPDAPGALLGLWLPFHDRVPGVLSNALRCVALLAAVRSRPPVVSGSPRSGGVGGAGLLPAPGGWRHTWCLRVGPHVSAHAGGPRGSPKRVVGGKGRSPAVAAKLNRAGR